MESSPSSSSSSPSSDIRSESMSPRLEDSPPSSPMPLPIIELKSSPSSAALSRPSSPVMYDSESSPMMSPVSSPVGVSPPSSPAYCSPHKTRKRYTYCEPEVPRKKLYWPEAPSIQEVLLSDQSPETAVNIDNNTAVIEDEHNLSVGVEDDGPLDFAHQREETNQNLNSTFSPHISDMSAESSQSSISGFSHGSSLSDDSVSLVSSVTDSELSSALSSTDSEHEDLGCSVGNNLKIMDNNELTVNEGVAMLMDLLFRHKLGKSTLKSVFETVLKFLPDKHNFPKTKHALFKYVRELCPPVEETIHYYCKKCLYYIGKECKKCPLCNCNESNKFFQLSLSAQIKNLFENHGLADIIDEYSSTRSSRRNDLTIYSDIPDGTEYKRAHNPGQYNLTLLSHTDGVSVSKSSNVSLWPLVCVICEVPSHLRFKMIIIVGVWVDSTEPNMNCYLGPYVNELNNINKGKGVTWVPPNTKEKESSLIAAPVMCADAPVRSDVQNILTHGGRYCCNNCEQKMAKLPGEPAQLGVRRIKRRRVFSWQEIPSTLRTSERMDAQRKVTEQNFRETGNMKRPEKGVKGLSVLFNSPNCDLSTMVYPEYMHILLGIIKQFHRLWFETDGAWSLKHHRRDIDTFLESLQVPDFITRIPRSTECYKQWKANENRSFLLYFSLVVLSMYMEEVYVQHWMLLVNSIFLLLQENISERDLSKAQIMIRMFLRDFSGLYRAADFSYNIHNLDHLCLTVKRWGPLWSNSAFMFEDFNGSLRQYIHGTRNQGKELINTIQLSQAVQLLKARNLGCTKEQKEENVFFSKANNFKMNGQQLGILKEFAFKCGTIFYRAKLKGQIYTCTAYCKQKKRNNFTICFKDNLGIRQYGEVSFYALCYNTENTNKHKMMFVKCFDIEHLRVFTHSESGVIVRHLIPVKESTKTLLLPIESILFKVIRVGGYVCVRPNTIEVNL